MKKIFIPILVILLLAGIGYGGYQAWWHMNFYVVERNEFNDAPPADLLKLVNDRIEDKQPVFDPDLVDGRLYEQWQINNSAAVFRLDCPDMKLEHHPELGVLYSSYAKAVAAKPSSYSLLPSINMIDGAAKQFDDGLYAAIDLACFEGKIGVDISAPEFVKTLFELLESGTKARAFLAGALTLTQVELPLTDQEAIWRDEYLAEFARDIPRSKPISFYTWNQELQTVWKFFRYLQREFTPDELVVPKALASAIEKSDQLSKQYTNLVNFYGRMSNPMKISSLIDLANGKQTGSFSVLPSSTTKENELFAKAFPMGVPDSANLMAELIRAIRNGTIDLEPNDDSGWYDHQIFALETMLMPERGAESNKLLLTKKYKQRLLEAFKALLTKRRETHARQIMATVDAKAAPPDFIQPRLRVEPNPTFYLRTARAYNFLETFLKSVDNSGHLTEAHGLTRDGERDLALSMELAQIRDRFYGLYLVSCEDIGMKHELSNEEVGDPNRAKKVALDWLEQVDTDPDLSRDTRVCVPAFVSQMKNETIMWGTLGVRLAMLEVEYETAPSIRADENSEWEIVENYKLGKVTYLIPVDEFSEFRLSGRRVLNRKEFRKTCDEHKTKEAILENLNR